MSYIATLHCWGGTYQPEIQEVLIIESICDTPKIWSVKVSLTNYVEIYPFNATLYIWNDKRHDYTCAMPIMVKTCSCYNLMQAVDQKTDNNLQWPYMYAQLGSMEGVNKIFWLLSCPGSLYNMFYHIFVDFYYFNFTSYKDCNSTWAKEGLHLLSWLYYIRTLSNHIITQESDNDEYDDGDDGSSDKDGNPNGIYQCFTSLV